MMQSLWTILALWLSVASLGASKFTYDVEMRDLDGSVLPVAARKLPTPTRSTGRHARRVTYTDDLCGAVQPSPASGKFSSIHSTWTVASASIPAGSAAGAYYLDQWVGIDGYSGSCSALVQAGTGIEVGKSYSFTHLHAVQTFIYFHLSS